MIFFGWRKICNHSRSAKTILTIIHFITYKPFPYNKKDPIFFINGKDWSGNSFLLNPKGLLANRWRYKDVHIVQYIALAAKRNYGDYKALNKKYLDLYLVEDKLSIIKPNPLLQIKNGKIFFKFEEITHTKGIH